MARTKKAKKYYLSDLKSFSYDIHNVYPLYTDEQGDFTNKKTFDWWKKLLAFEENATPEEKEIIKNLDYKARYLFFKENKQKKHTVNTNVSSNPGSVNESDTVRFLKLKPEEELKLIQYLQLAVNMNEKDIQRLETTYLDSHEFKFIKEFLPEKKDVYSYKHSLENLLTKYTLSYEKTTGKKINPSCFVNSKTVFTDITTNAGFTVNEFLKQAVTVKTAEEYETLYKTHSFTSVKVEYISPTKTGLYYPDSSIPVHITGTAAEDMVAQYDYAVKNGYDPIGIPSIEDIKENGIEIIQEKLTDLTNKLSLEYTKNQEQIANTMYDEHFNNSQTINTVDNHTTVHSNPLKEKHTYFINNHYELGCEVPSFGYRNDISGKISVLSGYKYIQSEDQNQTVILTKIEKNGNKSSIAIPKHIYENIIENSKIIANAPHITPEIMDKYNEYALLDENKQRVNTAVNFWHNYKAYCRKHCNNESEAMDAAKKIVREMKPDEQIKLKNQMLRYQKLTEQSYNDRLISFYKESVSDLKIHDTSGFHENTLNTIRHYTEVNTKIGSKLDENCNMKIGDVIKMNIDCKDVFKKSIFKQPAKELMLVSSCEENNTVVLMDKNKTSKFIIARDDFIQKVQKIEKKQIHTQRKQERQEYIVSY